MALSISDIACVLRRAKAGCDCKHNFPVFRRHSPKVRTFCWSATTTPTRATQVTELRHGRSNPTPTENAMTDTALNTQDETLTFDVSDWRSPRARRADRCTSPLRIALACLPAPLDGRFRTPGDGFHAWGGSLANRRTSYSAGQKRGPSLEATIMLAVLRSRPAEARSNIARPMKPRHLTAPTPNASLI
jgi:hypothetical protein